MSAPAPEMYNRIVSSDHREFRVSERALQQYIPSLDKDLLLYLPSNFIFLPTNTTPTPTTGSPQSPPSLMPTAPALFSKDVADRIKTPEEVTDEKVKAGPAPMEPQLQTTISRKCSRCGSTETCRWRQCRSTNILCNACFVYHRKYDKDRPESATEAYESRKMKKTH